MGTVIVVVRQPVIQIGLQLFKSAVNFASERNLIELLQDGFVVAFANAVGLRVAHNKKRASEDARSGGY